MPTVQERLASLEVRMAHVEVNTTETNSDVKELLAWRDEERGARAQRRASLKWVAAGLTALSGIVSAVVTALLGGVEWPS